MSARLHHLLYNSSARAGLALTIGLVALAGCGGSSHGPSSVAVVGTSGSGASADTGTTSSGQTSSSGGHDARAKDVPGASTTSATAGHTGAGASPSSGSGSTEKGGTGAHEVKPGGRPRTQSKAGTGGANRSKGPSSAEAPAGSTAKGLTPNPTNGVPLEVKVAAMEPTYKPFSTIYYDPTQVHPQVGQAVVYYFPVGVNEGECASAEVGGRACAVAMPGLTHVLSIARVVGLPGETIAVSDGHVVRNGQPASEPNIASCGANEPTKEPGCEYPAPITVPTESYYVLDDNRQLFQDDSRAFGAVVQAAIVGTVLGS